MQLIETRREAGPLFGRRVRVPGTQIEGTVTGSRDKTRLPAGEVYLPAYVEIDGEIQVHPTRIVLDEDPEFKDMRGCDKGGHLQRSIAHTHHHRLR